MEFPPSLMALAQLWWRMMPSALMVSPGRVPFGAVADVLLVLDHRLFGLALERRQVLGIGLRVRRRLAGEEGDAGGDHGGAVDHAIRGGLEPALAGILDDRGAARQVLQQVIGLLVVVVIAAQLVNDVGLRARRLFLALHVNLPESLP